jgi:hypothetical protein
MTMKKILGIFVLLYVSIVSYSQDHISKSMKFNDRTIYDTVNIGFLDISSDKIAFSDRVSVKNIDIGMLNGKCKMYFLVNKNCNLSAIQLLISDSSISTYETASLHAYDDNLIISDSSKFSNLLKYVDSKKEGSLENLASENKKENKCKISNWINYNDKSHKISALILLSRLSFETTYSIYIGKQKNGKVASIIFDLENVKRLMQEGIKMN